RGTAARAGTAIRWPRGKPGSALGRPAADAALHRGHPDWGRQDVSPEHRLAQPCAVFADRSDVAPILSRRTVAQSRSDLDHAYRRYRPAKDPYAYHGHGDRRPRVLQPGRQDHLV